jgi:hypothetical protein
LVHLKTVARISTEVRLRTVKARLATRAGRVPVGIRAAAVKPLVVVAKTGIEIAGLTVICARRIAALRKTSRERVTALAIIARQRINALTIARR